MDKKLIKIIGIVTSIVSISIPLVSGWVSDKQMEEIIDKKVNDAVANMKNTDRA